MKKLIVVATLTFLASIFGCSHRGAGPRIKVTCSIFPLADITSAVGGDLVDVQVLIPAGASPHTFEPSAREFEQFAATRVFVMVGAGLEFWAQKLIQAASSESLVVVMASDGVEMISEVPSGHKDAEPLHSHGRVGNPHIWLDPTIAKGIANRIASSLAQVDSAHASVYMANARDYASQLDSLDLEIQNAVKTFEIKEFVALHPAWSYFARRYGLKEVGVIEESPGREPTPKQLKEIIEEIGKFEIRAVFAEPQLSSRAAQAIAEEAGVSVLILDPLGGPDVPGRDSYLGLMRYNLEVIKRAMS